MKPPNEQIDGQTDQLFDHTAVVPAALAGQRVDKIAAAVFADFSRAELTRWINAGELLVDGAPVKPKLKLHGGERLQLRATERQDLAWHEAQPQSFAVLYEDEHLMVLDKPAGLVVHPGAGNASGTLVNGLLHRRPELASLPRAGLVHRLDKDTSGVMVVATNRRAQVRLAEMIAERAVHRQYLAVCEGRLVSGLEIERPIGRDPHVRTRQAIREDGKSALTSVRVEQRFRAHTLIHATLSTGRTHQIRVHMRSIGHPLVGDRRYGARGRLPTGPTTALVTVVQGFGRQALHAQRLAFDHPFEDEHIDIKSNIPNDLQDLIDKLDEDLVERTER